MFSEQNSKSSILSKIGGLAGALSSLLRSSERVGPDVPSEARLIRSAHTLRSRPNPKISLKNKRPHLRGVFLVFHGGLAGARTRDLRLKRALLYLLSYKPE